MSQSKTKKLLAFIAVAVLAVAMGIGIAWFLINNVIVGWKVYPRNARELDLRGTGISAEQYEAVREKLPHCKISWEVPIQGTFFPNDTTELTIASVTDEEIRLLGYFSQLEVIHAEDCKDYASLTKIREAYPNCQLLYTVTIDSVEYHQDATEVALSHLTDEEVELLDNLPLLETVHAENCDDYAQLADLQERRPACQVIYAVTIAGQDFAVDAAELTVNDAETEELLTMLQYLPRVESVHLVNPVSDAQSVLQLQETCPDIAFTWEVEIFGKSFTSTDTEIDISGTALESVDQVAAAMEYLPGAQTLIMSDCGIDNETMAAFRETMREAYKVVWTVMCGDIPVRTDETTFQPVREGVYYFFDEDAYNLRYCEELVVVDVGHMSLHDIGWVEYLPHLKYLILAHTTVLDITPLSNCKELIFLELDWTGIKDYTPLLGCTALEDLNLGLTYGDAEPISQMTWLKNLWWKDCGYSKQNLLRETLTDTNLMFNPAYTAGSGWRKLQNYYDMRDLLGMPYMD